MTACKIPQTFRGDETYWREKLAAFLHDPPDKALDIRGHESRAKTLRDKLFVSADDDLVLRADQVASGLDRTFLPRKEDQGDIDFCQNPVITHPTGQNRSLKLKSFPKKCTLEEILELIAKDEEKLPDTQPLRSFALFHYFLHVFPYRLAQEKTCGVSWQWPVLPADTRLPDHAIWQHCALTSALYSCYRLSSRRQASLMLFSLTPVQDFIARSRKLRDFWTASLILSWLAAEGMKTVILHYGSDHIIYPSPLGQALIESFLDRECGFYHWKDRYHYETRAATLPNKFIFLCPAGLEEECFYHIKERTNRAWKALANAVKDLVARKCNFSKVPAKCLSALEKIFTRQVGRFWEYHWAAAPLIDEKTLDAYQEIFPLSLSESLKNLLKKARECRLPYLSYAEKFFYPLTHDLVQRGLAAEKLTPSEKRAEEPGIKCHLHPDLEALRFSCVECKRDGHAKCELFEDHQPDENPRPSKDPLWRKIRAGFPQTEFKATERLSAIGLIKRLALKAVSNEHPLYLYFSDSERFPSTTEIAIKDWYEKVKEHFDAFELKDVAEFWHQKDESLSKDKDTRPEICELKGEKFAQIEGIIKKLPQEKHIKSQHFYYAILVMDGDHMGRLLAGGFEARWRDVIHPELVNRIYQGEISEKFWPCFWKDYLEEKRSLSPAVHAAISKALSDFALHTVPEIVSRHRGCLIYAGGDDVCAVFPTSSAIAAALEIARAYNWAFVRRGKSAGQKGQAQTIREIVSGQELSPEDELLLHLGPGEGISISGGLLMVHHKWPLRAALERAHALLELAKDNGRAALALELQRRAGERRTFVAGFKDLVRIGPHAIDPWEAFSELVKAFALRRLSASFAYRPRELAEGLEALWDKPEEIARLIQSQIRSEKIKDKGNLWELARKVAAVLLADRRLDSKEIPLAYEALEIARFLAGAEER
ncbi:type III-B CRISPR-associated protein Cas10/Cmr2 [Thermodesulfatator atlanticus]|uniref:type III-B CRISPR-associated protein Cas10/Cmr2 n=1 Tax=Thermodesulfatator atlanticus TaxID=501497 RepID=UPI0003B4AFF1|nr:type III-B CRISPR-associated protein Cas10/Cmr2 [Thermodesulfatator atlanticus]